MDRALNYLETHLRREGASDDEVEICCTIARVCMKQNFFSFRGKHFEQVFGLSMGSKISLYLANIFMSCLEEEIRTQTFSKDMVAICRQCVFRHQGEIQKQHLGLA